MTSQEVTPTIYDIFFNTIKSKELRVPYIRSSEPIVYKCDGKEGSICFDGYYYVEDTPPPYPEDLDIKLRIWERPKRWPEHLPKTLYMHMRHREKEPYKEEYDSIDKCTRVVYKILEEHKYIIEVYKRIIHECTDEYSEVTEEDGSIMNVCFFPTNRQTIYFRVLEPSS